MPGNGDMQKPEPRRPCLACNVTGNFARQWIKSSSERVWKAPASPEPEREARRQGGRRSAPGRAERPRSMVVPRAVTQRPCLAAGRRPRGLPTHALSDLFHRYEIHSHVVASADRAAAADRLAVPPMRQFHDVRSFYLPPSPGSLHRNGEGQAVKRRAYSCVPARARHLDAPTRGCDRVLVLLLSEASRRERQYRRSDTRPEWTAGHGLPRTAPRARSGHRSLPNNPSSSRAKKALASAGGMNSPYAVQERAPSPQNLPTVSTASVIWRFDCAGGILPV
jgi:hypothetical protein